MEEIIAVLGFILFLVSIPAIFIYKAYTRHKEHIEMLNRGVNPAQFTSPPVQRASNASLMLGLLSMFTGLAFIISAVLVQKSFDRDLMTGGVIFIFVGTAFLIYWKMTTADRDRARRIQEEHYKWLLEQAKTNPVQETTSLKSDPEKM